MPDDNNGCNDRTSIPWAIPACGDLEHHRAQWADFGQWFKWEMSRVLSTNCKHWTAKSVEGNKQCS